MGKKCSIRTQHYGPFPTKRHGTVGFSVGAAEKKKFDIAKKGSH
jgi:hypothetical protein